MGACLLDLIPDVEEIFKKVVQTFFLNLAELGQFCYFCPGKSSI